MIMPVGIPLVQPDFIHAANDDRDVVICDGLKSVVVDLDARGNVRFQPLPSLGGIDDLVAMQLRTRSNPPVLIARFLDYPVESRSQDPRLGVRNKDPGDEGALG